MGWTAFVFRHGKIPVNRADWRRIAYEYWALESEQSLSTILVHVYIQIGKRLGIITPSSGLYQHYGN